MTDWQAELTALLERLMAHDKRWLAVPSPGTVTLTRGWEDGTVDTVVISGPRGAYATRNDPGDREVWCIEGTAADVVEAAETLPAPSDPDAPDGTGHKPRITGQWT